MAAPLEPVSRRIVGNLGCESEFPGKKAQATLPARVAKGISAFATLLRTFAREEDSLWTPVAVDASRLPPVPGLPVPLLESGALEKLPAVNEILAWAETPDVERARRRGSSAVAEEAQRAPASKKLEERLWELPAAAPDVVAKVNHRAFCLEVALDLGQALPGARLIHSLGKLEAHWLEGGASASIGEKWVLKAPHSAAGRDQIRGQGKSTDGSSRKRIERLLERHGVLLFEPWMDRLEDFGALGLIGEEGTRVLGAHKQEIDSNGVFRGIVLPPEGACCPWLAEEEEHRLEETAAKVGHRLERAGYRGPFGVDSWRYRALDGSIKLQALGEINARMSFGLVARGLAERLRSSGVLDPTKEMRLRLGQSIPPDALPLLLPGADKSEAASVF